MGSCFLASDWREHLTEVLEAPEAELRHCHERTSRPLGEPAFPDRIERMQARIVRPATPGRKPKRLKK